MITLLKFLVMAVAALAEKAFLADLRPSGGGVHVKLALPRARFDHLADGAEATPRQAK